MNVFDEGNVSLDEFVAVAHAVDVALRYLEVTAHNPVQGEAMHKVIAFHALNAFEFAELDENGKALFRIIEE